MEIFGVLFPVFIIFSFPIKLTQCCLSSKALLWEFPLLAGATVGAIDVVSVALVLLVLFLVKVSRIWGNLFEFFFVWIICIFSFKKYFRCLQSFSLGHDQKSVVLNQGVQFLPIAGLFYSGYLPVQSYVGVSSDYWYVPAM